MSGKDLAFLYAANAERLHETTAEHFAMFEDEAGYWLAAIGLQSWKVRLYHDDFGNPSVLADCTWHMSGRVATIRLNRFIAGDEPSEVDVRRAAFHEVCELLFAEITDRLNEYHANDENDRRVHEIIRVMENTLFKSRWKARHGKAG